jgi:polysaccharide export outer membrane protein
MLGTVRGVRDCVWLWLICLVLLVLGSTGRAYGQDKFQTSQQTNERIQQLASAARTRPVDTPIGTGDLVHVEVFDVPDLTREVRVNESGLISLPLIPGRIQASGLTTYQLEQKVAELLLENGLVSHPQVSVFVKEQNSQPITVVGAVLKPATFQAIRQTTLLEALAQAGGIADDAANELNVLRPVAPDAAAKDGNSGGGADPPGATQSINVRLTDLLYSGDPTFNIPVYGGDIINVPRSGIVFVTGAVNQPGGYVLASRGQPLTTLQAVTMARGLSGYAKPNDAVIIRLHQDTGVKEEIPVQLKQIMDRKKNDIRLFANDTLYIPESGGRKAFYKIGGAALGIGSSIIVFRAAQ